MADDGQMIAALRTRIAEEGEGLLARLLAGQDQPYASVVSATAPSVSAEGAAALRLSPSPLYLECRAVIRVVLQS